MKIAIKDVLIDLVHIETVGISTLEKSRPMDKSSSKKSVTLDHDWQSGKSLGECNMEMLNTKLLADVTCYVGKKRVPFHVHKYVLVSRSAAFFTMFCMRSPPANEISIPDVDPEVFDLLLRFIYSDEVELNAKTVTPLLYVAKKFQVGDLVKICVGRLREGIAADSVCSLLEQAHQYGETELQNKCLEYIYNHAHAVFKSPSFQDLCGTCLGKIIESDHLRAEEARVYEAVYNWSSKACRKNKLQPNDDNRHRMLGNLRYLIRFPVMDVDYFTKYVSTQNLLTKDEKIAIFQYLHSRSQPSVEPFKTNRRSVTRVLRFQAVTTDWSVGDFYCDAIDFQSSRDVILDGVIIYGSADEEADYKVWVKILDESGNQLSKRETEIETEPEQDYYDVILDKSVKIKAQTWYTISVTMTGENTKRGINGRDMVYCEQVQFMFKTSTIPRNCTTVKEGQIPGILFHD